MLPLVAFFQFLDDSLVDDLAVVHRCLHVLVPEQFLYCGHAHSLHEQQRGIGMACRVEGKMLNLYQNHLIFYVTVYLYPNL